jgi:hypothetical protein
MQFFKPFLLGLTLSTLFTVSCEREEAIDRTPGVITYDPSLQYLQRNEILEVGDTYQVRVSAQAIGEKSIASFVTFFYSDAILTGRDTLVKRERMLTEFDTTLTYTATDEPGDQVLAFSLIDDQNIPSDFILPYQVVSGLPEIDIINSAATAFLRDSTLVSGITYNLDFDLSVSGRALLDSLVLINYDDTTSYDLGDTLAFVEQRVQLAVDSVGSNLQFQLLLFDTDGDQVSGNINYRSQEPIE